MSLKKNINRVHFLLSEEFESVDIKEKVSKDLGNYLEISIKEDLECRIVIPKKDLESEHFKWKYFSNPNDSESFLIERVSSVESIKVDVRDIFDKKRFDSEYLK